MRDWDVFPLWVIAAAHWLGRNNKGPTYERVGLQLLKRLAEILELLHTLPAPKSWMEKWLTNRIMSWAMKEILTLDRLAKANLRAVGEVPSEQFTPHQTGGAETNNQTI